MYKIRIIQIDICLTLDSSWWIK